MEAENLAHWLRAAGEDPGPLSEMGTQEKSGQGERRGVLLCVSKFLSFQAGKELFPPSYQFVSLTFVLLPKKKNQDTQKSI